MTLQRGLPDNPVDRSTHFARQEIEAAADIDGHTATLLYPRAIDLRPWPSTDQAKAAAQF